MDSIVVTGGGAAAGRNSDCRRQERLSDTDAGNASDRRAADADQRAAAFRHPDDDALLQSLGAEVSALQDGQVLALSSHGFKSDGRLRHRAQNARLDPGAGPASGPRGQASVSLPGGCAIGARPVDLHLKGSRRWAPSCSSKKVMSMPPPRRPEGRTFEFPIVSVGATENVLMAATLAKGTTVLKNAAREPEIVDLAACLIAMGAQIEGAGTSTITSRRGPAGRRDPCRGHRPDRAWHLHAGACDLPAARSNASAGGSTLSAPSAKARRRRDRLSRTPNGLKVARKNGRVEGCRCTTEPFPGFPTDLQAQMMALLCTARAERSARKYLREPLHACARTDADGRRHRRSGRHRHRDRRRRLKGAPVMATDLRASVSLILAGLAAEGETVVSRVYHLDRGYEHVVRKLSGVGAQDRTSVTRHDRGRQV